MLAVVRCRHHGVVAKVFVYGDSKGDCEASIAHIVYAHVMGGGYEVTLPGIPTAMVAMRREFGPKCWAGVAVTFEDGELPEPNGLTWIENIPKPLSTSEKPAEFAPYPVRAPRKCDEVPES